MLNFVNITGLYLSYILFIYITKINISMLRKQKWLKIILKEEHLNTCFDGIREELAYTRKSIYMLTYISECSKMTGTFECLNKYRQIFKNILGMSPARQ